MSQLSVDPKLADASEVKGKVKLFVFPFERETMAYQWIIGPAQVQRNSGPR